MDGQNLEGSDARHMFTENNGPRLAQTLVAHLYEVPLQDLRRDPAGRPRGLCAPGRHVSHDAARIELMV